MDQLPEPKPMSEWQIVNKAEKLWKEYIDEVGWDYVFRNGIKFDDVYEAVIYPKYEVIIDKNQYLDVDDFGNPILGQFLPKENTALINRQLFETKDPRTAFTEWHEVAGHGILHGALLRKNANRLPKLNTTQRAIDTFLKHYENRFEWQANAFAANIGAPRILVALIYMKLFGMRHRFLYRGSANYFLSVNGHSFKFFIASIQELAWQMGRLMQHYFGWLSAQSLSYQIINSVIDSNVEKKDVHKCDFAHRIGNIIEDMNII